MSEVKVNPVNLNRREILAYSNPRSPDINTMQGVNKVPADKKISGRKSSQSVNIMESKDATSVKTDQKKKEKPQTTRAEESEKISRKYFVDKITGKIVVRIIKGDSEVVKQVPPEYQMAIARYLRVMSMMNE